MEGFYRESYHLTLKTNGEIGICTTCTDGNHADECRWELSGAITGMTVTNCGEAVNLGVDLDNGTVAGVTSYVTDAWHVMPICLNVETEYQRTSNTCGAASGVMINNYLRPASTMDEHAYVSDIEYREGTESYKSLKNTALYLNYLMGLTSSSGEYKKEKSMSEGELCERLSKSLNVGYPAMIQMKSLDEDKDVWGYSAGPSGSGHYVVAKGIFYNPLTNQYEVALNDAHYRFGFLSGYKSKNVGGRDIVVTLAQLYKVNTQRERNVMYYE